jgi:hypothetical protein
MQSIAVNLLQPGWSQVRNRLQANLVAGLIKAPVEASHSLGLRPSHILDGHQELGRRPRQPTLRARWFRESGCGSYGNQAASVGPPRTRGSNASHLKLFGYGRPLAFESVEAGMTCKKPKLVLLHGRMITAENIAKMFKALTAETRRPARSGWSGPTRSWKKPTRN